MANDTYAIRLEALGQEAIKNAFDAAGKSVEDLDARIERLSASMADTKVDQALKAIIERSKAAKDSFEGMGDAVDSFISKATGLDKTTLGFGDFGKILDGIASKFTVANVAAAGFTAGIAAIGYAAKTAFDLVVAGVETVVTGFTSLVTQSAQLAAGFERQGILLKNAFKDTGVAEELRDWADTMEDRITLDSDIIVQKLVQLKAAGLDLGQIQRVFLAIGDAAEGSGQSFESIQEPLMRIQATGQVAGRDLKALADTIPGLYEKLGEKFGMTADQMAQLKAGAIDGKQAFTELIGIIEKQYTGAMQKSWNSIDNFLTAVTRKWEDAVRTLIFPPEVSDKLNSMLGSLRREINETLDSEEFSSFARTISKEFGIALEDMDKDLGGLDVALRKLIKSAEPLVGGAIKYMREKATELIRYLESVNWEKLGERIQKAFSAAGTIFEIGATPVRGWIAIFEELGSLFPNLDKEINAAIKKQDELGKAFAKTVMKSNLSDEDRKKMEDSLHAEVTALNKRQAALQKYKDFMTSEMQGEWWEDAWLQKIFGFGLDKYYESPAVKNAGPIAAIKKSISSPSAINELRSSIANSLLSATQGVEDWMAEYQPQPGESSTFQNLIGFTTEGIGRLKSEIIESITGDKSLLNTMQKYGSELAQSLFTGISEDMERFNKMRSSSRILFDFVAPALGTTSEELEKGVKTLTTKIANMLPRIQKAWEGGVAWNAMFKLSPKDVEETKGNLDNLTTLIKDRFEGIKRAGYLDAFFPNKETAQNFITDFGNVISRAASIAKEKAQEWGKAQIEAEQERLKALKTQMENEAAIRKIYADAEADRQKTALKRSQETEMMILKQTQEYAAAQQKKAHEEEVRLMKMRHDESFRLLKERFEEAEIYRKREAEDTYKAYEVRLNLRFDDYKAKLDRAEKIFMSALNAKYEALLTNFKRQLEDVEIAFTRRQEDEADAFAKTQEKVAKAFRDRIDRIYDDAMLAFRRAQEDIYDQQGVALSRSLEDAALSFAEKMDAKYGSAADKLKRQIDDELASFQRKQEDIENRYAGREIPIYIKRKMEDEEKAFKRQLEDREKAELALIEKNRKAEELAFERAQEDKEAAEEKRLRRAQEDAKVAFEREQADKRAIEEEAFRDQQEADKLAFDRAQEDEKLAFKRQADDRLSEEERRLDLEKSREEDLYKRRKERKLEEFTLDQQRELLRFKREQEDIDRLEKRRFDQRLAFLQIYADQEMRALKELQEEEARGFKEDQEAEQLRLRREQEDAMKQLDLRLRLEAEQRNQQTKAIIEAATSIKNFKANIEQRMKFVATEEFSQAMTQLLKEKLQIEARIESVAVAGV
jgi:tape measure domain-containing protein